MQGVGKGRPIVIVSECRPANASLFRCLCSLRKQLSVAPLLAVPLDWPDPVYSIRLNIGPTLKLKVKLERPGRGEGGTMRAK
jgi:hypothetical protein